LGADAANPHCVGLRVKIILSAAKRYAPASSPNSRVVHDIVLYDIVLYDIVLYDIVLLSYFYLSFP